VCTYGEQFPRGHPRAPPRRRARPASRPGQHDQRDGRHAVGGFARRAASRPHAGRVGPPRRGRRRARLRPRRDPQRLPRPAAPLPPRDDRRPGHVRGPLGGQRGAGGRRARLPDDQHLADAARLGDPGRSCRAHRRRPADPPGRAVGPPGREALHAGGAAHPARVRRAGRAAAGPVQPADRAQPLHQRGHRQEPRQGHPAQAGCSRPGPRRLAGAVQPPARVHLRRPRSGPGRRAPDRRARDRAGQPRPGARRDL
ncbi:MAG: Two-component transcriptional response regulator, LuxR family, partial [uncultured Blastococcus sp.]